MALEGEDLISQLPDSLLHQILALIPTRDAARTSTLSKRWNFIWQTHPFLDFGFDFYCDQYLNDRYLHLYPNRWTKGIKKRKYLLQVASKTILRRCQQIPNLEKLCIVIPQHKICADHLNGKLKTWMRAVAKSGLKELSLENCCGGGRDCPVLSSTPNYFDYFESDYAILPPSENYFASGYAILPATVLLARSIRVLHLSYFNLRSLSSLSIKFPSLQNLSLSSVKLEDRIIEKLIVGCPLLETLKLQLCKGLNTLYLTGLQKLRQVELRKILDLKMLKVEGTPNLQTLTISIIAPLAVVDVTAFACLRHLVLYGRFVTENLFQQFVSQSPFLEYLTIGGSEAFNKIEISTNTIKELKLFLLHNLVEAKISASMLETFMCVNGYKPLPTFFLNASNLLKVSLDLNGCPTGAHEQLMEFLGYFSHCRSVKLFGGGVAKLMIPKEQRDGLESPLHGTRDLGLFPHMKIEPRELVERMLCLCPRVETLAIGLCPHVKILSMGSLPVGCYLDKIKIVLKFLYEKNDPCCKLLQSECWRHSLVEVRIENFEGDEDEVANLKNLFHQLGVKVVENAKIASASSKFDPFDGLYACYDELFF